MAGSHRDEGTTAVRSTPRFLQGVYSFEGKGLDAPSLLDAALSYVVPDGATTQPVYLRAGNAAAELVCLVLMRDGQPMRYFPIGARAGTHVALRVVEDLEPGTGIELHAAAPAGISATIVVDLGLVEVE
jgi:assimilatory nitrate reductase catalytic subunit